MNIPQRIKNMFSKDILNGYIRFIYPNKLNSIIKEGFKNPDKIIPFAITAFGDILTYEKDKYICLVSFINNSSKVLSSNIDQFFDDLKDMDYINEIFDIDYYYDAIDKYGKLNNDECYGFIPIISFNNKKDTRNLCKVKYNEYLHLVIQMNGKIK